MEILLVRHAIAAPADPGRPDAERPLTPEGRGRFEKVVKGLGRIGLRVDRVYHSPLLRAVETAELLAPLLSGESVVSPGLGAPPELALLESLEGERAALVGHEPWMSTLCAWLVLGGTRGSAEGSGHRFPFKKGGVAWLDGEPEPGGMRLLAFLPPRVAREIR